MKVHYPILLAALAAAVPVAAQNQGTPPAAQGVSIRPLAPSAPAVSQGSGDAGAVAGPDGPVAEYRVDARTNRVIGPGCVYLSSVQGTLRAPAELSEADTVRDADLRTEASIECGGRVVTSRAERLVIPAATARAVRAGLEKGLTVSRPGERCLHSVALRIGHGRIEPERAIDVCKPGPDAAPTPAPAADAARSGAR